MSDRNSTTKTYEIGIHESGRAYVTVHGTKKRFPDCWSFSNKENARTWISNQRQLDHEREAEKKAKRAAKSAARKAIVNPYKVGDVLYNSWGYDQTNVDWYQVVRVSSKSVYLRSISGVFKETSSMAGNSIPSKNAFAGETFRKTLQVLNDGEVYVSIDHGWVSKWSGEDVYESHYA